MPLTALLATGDVLDATSCRDEDWERVHRARPRVDLTCRGCDGSMHAKRSRRSLRFFAHDQLREDCPSAGETAEHLWLKTTLAKLVRDAGWRSIIEATPSAEDTGGWRADVLAVGPSGERVALEAQLAPMTTAVGEERTAVYATDGIRALWVTTKNTPWLYEIPGVKVGVTESASGDHGSEPLLVSRGCVQLSRNDDGSVRWLVRTDLDAGRLIDGFLKGRSVAHRIGHLWDTFYAGSQPRYDSHTDAIAVVPTSHVAEIQRRKRLQEAERRRRRAEQERWEAEQAAHAANIRALIDRQERLLPIAIAEIARRKPGARLWLGVPPTEMAGTGEVSINVAAGNERTGQGAVVWTGPDRDNLRLAAVVCPVANLVSEELGLSWRRRRVAVYVADQREGRRVGNALGWSLDSFTIPTSPSGDL